MAAAEQPPPRGFQTCFADLKDRRLRELGAAWDSVAPRSRRAEAARRARDEMARRIEVRTGRRYADSTIARWAARDHWPPNAEPFWLQRWAAIDRAGGVSALADVLGVTPARVLTWRDSLNPDAPLPAPMTPPRPGQRRKVGVVVDGFAIIGSTVIPKRVPTSPDQPYQELLVDPESEIIEAWFSGDTDRLKELLGPLVAEQVISQWASASHYPDVSYKVTDILEFYPNIDE